MLFREDWGESSFSCSFRENISQIACVTTHEGLMPPPLGNPGSATGSHDKFTSNIAGFHNDVIGR